MDLGTSDFGEKQLIMFIITQSTEIFQVLITWSKFPMGGLSNLSFHFKMY